MGLSSSVHLCDLQPGVTLFVVCGLFFFVLCIFCVTQYFSRNLHHIPGPLLNGCSPIPRILSVWSGKSQLHDLSLHRKYGHLVRMAPNSISVSDPDEIDQIYGVSSKFFKSRFFDPVRFHDDEGLIPDPFVLTDKATHSRMKRNAANAYAVTSLVQLEPLFDDSLSRLLVVLDTRYARTGVPCDMTTLLQAFALDSVMNITYGRDLRLMEDEGSRWMVGALDDSLKYLSIIGQVPWLHKWLHGNPYYGRLIQGNNTIVDKFFDVAFAETDTAERNKAEREGPCTFVQRLILNKDKNPSSLNTREINTHTFGNITAGGDTTATALCAVMIRLMERPDVLSQVRKEMEDAQLLETPIVSFVEANRRLPYLGAVIKESMRLHPSVQLPLSREVPAEGATICGNFIPGGTEVGINPYVINRDPKIFVQPDVFRPKRWLKYDVDAPDDKTLGSMNRTFFTFGAGPHTCSGRHISSMEIIKCISALFSQFDFSTPGSPGQPLSTKNYWIAKQKNLNVIVKRR